LYLRNRFLKFQPAKKNIAHVEIQNKRNVDVIQSKFSPTKENGDIQKWFSKFGLAILCFL
jgi:hypothetical protein